MTGDADKRSMGLQFAMPKQVRQERKRVTRDRLVDERLLTLQCLGSTTTGGVVVRNGGVDDLWEEFTNGPEPACPWRVAEVPRLAQHELTALGTVAEVKPVRNSGNSSHQLFD
jgi:hypothetical protein